MQEYLGKLADRAHTSLTAAAPEAWQELPARFRWSTLGRSAAGGRLMVPTKTEELTLLDAAQVMTLAGAVQRELASSGGLTPGVTLVSVACGAVFLRPGGFEFTRVCLNPFVVVHSREYYRIVTSAFTHMNLPHLCGNLGALVGDGCWLERQDGTLAFLVESAAAVLVSGALNVGVAYLMAKHTSEKRHYYYSGSIGLSGVCTALCVVSGFRRRGRTLVFGLFEIPSEITCWWHMLNSQILAPRSSFLGHACGLASGLLITAFPAVAARMCNMVSGNRKTENRRDAQSGRQRRRLLRIGPIQISPLLLHLLCAAGVAGVQLLLNSSRDAERNPGKQRGACTHVITQRKQDGS